MLGSPRGAESPQMDTVTLVSDEDESKMIPRMLGLFLLCAFFWPNAAFAYIGPGAGLGAIGTLIALIGAVMLAVVGFLWYPLKRLLRKEPAPSETPDAGDRDA